MKSNVCKIENGIKNLELISGIGISSSKLFSLLLQEIPKLQSNEYAQPYKQDAMLDNLSALEKEYKKNKNEFRFRNESYGKDYSEQAILLQNYVDSQKGEK